MFNGNHHAYEYKMVRALLIAGFKWDSELSLTDFRGLKLGLCPKY